MTLVLHLFLKNNKYIFLKWPFIFHRCRNLFKFKGLTQNKHEVHDETNIKKLQKNYCIFAVVADVVADGHISTIYVLFI